MNQSRRGMGVKMEDLVSQKQENFTPLPGIELMKAWVVPYLLQLKMVTRATTTAVFTKCDDFIIPMYRCGDNQHLYVVGEEGDRWRKQGGK